MSLVLRVIDDEKIKESNYFIEEYLLGLIGLRSFDATSLADTIVNMLKTFDVDLTLCIALCFDSASVMTRRNTGVQAILLIADVCISTTYVSEFYSIIKKIHNYFTVSGVTNKYFRQAQTELQFIHTNLKLWADVRWDSQWTSIDAILQNYEVIILAFNELIADGGSIAKVLDYGKAQQLILSVIEELNSARDEKSFQQLFQLVISFCGRKS
ncbi:unnamed protein product [Rotaria sp. Silwood2]|nr:unnamed protein product [Rotaria sp. Silwood2]CAF2985405.1 unnamed protein product [Rotaria sp. Silwood2]CAF3363173.1 unnamed protein product [Rotaria sp. Silwood2]CAF4318860.1 unnamed protein product [Rotaria sp. Silwood2]CAF4477198.1 unnamed protein product [Rotaria sp. Silwood2]